MAVQAVLPHITYCPPAAAGGSESRETVQCGRLPVGARFEAHGEVESTGIGFEDFAKMHQVTRTCGNSRRYETPSWIFSKKRFEEVFLKYCDLRVHKDTSQIKDRKLRLDEIARLWLAEAQMRERILDHLCTLYVEEKKQGVVRRRIEANIENLDSMIRMLRRGPSVVAAIIYSHYMRGMDSVQVGEEHGLKPPAVRHLIWRLNKIAGERLVRIQKKEKSERFDGEYVKRGTRRSWTGKCECCGAPFESPFEATVQRQS